MTSSFLNMDKFKNVKKHIGTALSVLTFGALIATTGCDVEVHIGSKTDATESSLPKPKTRDQQVKEFRNSLRAFAAAKYDRVKSEHLANPLIAKGKDAYISTYLQRFDAYYVDDYSHDFSKSKGLIIRDIQSDIVEYEKE